MRKDLRVLRGIVHARRQSVQLRVIVPGRDRHGRRVPTQTITAVECELARIAGGSTTMPGVGRWVNRAGRLVRERVRVVEIYVAAPFSKRQQRRMERCLKRILVGMNQEVLAVAVNGRMTFIPRPTQKGDGGSQVNP